MDQKLFFKKYDAIMFLLYTIIQDKRTPKELVKDINKALELINNMKETDDITNIRVLLENITGVKLDDNLKLE